MKFVTINQDACTQCEICIKEFSCPSFTRTEDKKIIINQDLCNNNGSCIQVCPEKAIEFKKQD